MKNLFKNLLSDLVIGFTLTAVILLVMAIIWNTIELALYAFIIAATSCSIGYLYLRGPN